MTHDARRLKVAVDASWFGPTARGMARHAMTLLGSRHVTPVLLNAPGAVSSLLGAPLPQPIFEQLRFHRAAERTGADVCLSPYNTSPIAGRTSLLQVTVIHDLIYLDETAGGAGARSTRRQALGRLYRRWVVPRAARRADVVVTVSGMMRERLVQQLGVSAADVFVVPNAADDDLYRSYVHVPKERPRLLAVSGSAPHKNLARLVRAVTGLVRAGVVLDVDVVGLGPEEGLRLLRAEGADAAGNAFTFLKGISRADLHAVYRRATCFVMPSLAEGFGIPLLEALAAGIPCTASDLPIFREIAGADCAYFDPLSTRDLAHSIRELLVRSQASRVPAVERRPARSALRYSSASVAASADELWTRLESRVRERPA
jgi:glycosyltransferase involved in cell wall biosynthesis